MNSSKQRLEPPAISAPLTVAPVSKKGILPRERLISNIEKRMAMVEKIMQGLNKYLN